MPGQQAVIKTKICAMTLQHEDLNPHAPLMSEDVQESLGHAIITDAIDIYACVAV